MENLLAYQTLSKKLLRGLPQRTIAVLERRFGLTTGTRETLEAIGTTYKITRERVRQIEREGFLKMQPRLKECAQIFQYFHDELKAFGDVKKEDTLLLHLGKQKFQNHAFLFLTLADGIQRVSEDTDFYTYWTRNPAAIQHVKQITASTLQRLKKEKRPLSLQELFLLRKNDIAKTLGRKAGKDVFHSYIEICKTIQKNPEGQFGLRDWLEINPKGIKDKAYLVLKKQEEPLHFTTVARMIEQLPFPPQKKIHIATVHNELIKDDRFVLVGRGLYALKDWGYTPGVVKEIIVSVLKKSKKSLSKQEIVKKVLKQRLVKKNTISLNLQDRNYFFKDLRGRYTINSIKQA